MNRTLVVGVVGTLLWALAFRVGVANGMAIEALSLASIAVVILVARLVPELRTLLRPTVRDVIIGVVFGAVTVAATVGLYPPLRDLDVVPGLAREVKRFYGIVPFAAAMVPLIVLVAAAEELMWRGLFFAALARAPVVAAIGLSAVAYAIGQLGGSPMLGGVALFFGVLWGIEAKLTKGLVAPMISHLMWTTSIFGVWPLE